MHIPFELIVDSSDNFVSLAVTVAQLELEADPNHLVPANLNTKPYTALTPMTNPEARVRLLGPGLTITFAGSDLSDIGVKITGDSESTDPTFPSGRFDPPHFIIGTTRIGVACDEVLLDLDPEHNPAIVDSSLPGVNAAWRGLYLKELGIFIGTGDEVGTWGGMASVKDFFLGFDGTDITGTFTAELVHHVLNDPPQVVVEAEYVDASGSTQTSTNDVEIPRSPEGHGRVRLRAQPNWDSAGFRVQWTLPDGAAAEEPGRLSSLDLGWVTVGEGDSVFTVLITDHRVPDQTVNFTVHVPAAPADGTPNALTFLFEGFPINPDDLNDRPTQRVHMRLRPGQQATVTAHLARGTGNPVDATIQLPTGYTLLVGSPTQTANRPATSNNYNDLAWGFAAPSSAPANKDDVIVVTATDNGVDTQRRLRISWEEAPSDGAPDFVLTSYTDWRADPGLALARVEVENALPYDNIVWTLERQSIDASLFTDAGKDGFFQGGAYESTSNVYPAYSAGTIRPELTDPETLYRLTGTVPAGPLGSTSSVVIAETKALNEQDVTTFAGTLVTQVTDGTPTTIHFTYDSDAIQGTTMRNGPEAAADRLTLDQVNALQAQGFVALYQAVEKYGESIDSIGLFGAASVEGEDAYNLDLSHRRVDAAKAALLSPPSALAVKMSDVASGYSVPSAVQSKLANLDTAGKIQTFFIGEHTARTPIDPHDRRVFAVIKLAPPPVPGTIVHREYFVTLPGAPAPSSSPNTPARKLQDHPFRHSIFRLVHVELQLLRNEFVRFQLKLVLDLEAMDEDDRLEAPHTDLPTGDGVTTFFLELKRNPNPGPNDPEFSWEAVALADPTDKDGFAVIQNPTVLGVLGGPSVVVPALTALSGGKTGLSGFVIAAAAGMFLTSQGLLDVQHIIWQGIRLKLKHGNVPKPTMSFAVDYTVKYNIKCNLQEKLGIPIDLTTTNPIEISFRNVGVELQSMEQVEFFYNPMDGFSIDVNDPGVFKLGDSIGRLLQVNRLRSGAGSPIWFEIELGLSIDTGIFSLDTLRIRIALEAKDLFPASGEVTLDDSAIDISDLSVSINKLGVSANVPGVLRGKGMLGFSGAGGGLEIEGSLDLDLVPLSLRIYGGMKFVSKADLVSLYAYLGTVFAPGIPLGSTGVAIYGFEGLVAVHMGRSNPDLLQWYLAAPTGATDTNKWNPERGSWAFGVGTVLGTVYDTGFTFNTKGGFMLELPGPKISLATQTNFVQKAPSVSDSEQGTIVSTILLDFENHIFQVGMDFVYEVPHLIRFHIPVEVFFNLASANDWHIRFGQWDPSSKRISIRVLDLFDAYGYFVVEGNGLNIPGKLDLHGVCVGHGVRAEIFWGSKSVGIYLEAFLEYHIGLQISPLMLQGNATVGGKLHLGPCSLGASGSLDVKAPDPFVVHGEFCGEIDLWLFSISGCVSFEIGDGDAGIPDPPNPFKELTVIDRMTSAKVDNPNAAPLDAVVHLTFNSDITDACTPQAAPSLSPGPFRNQISNDLFYRFDLTSVKIVDLTAGGAVVDPLQKAWGPYSLPNATPEEASSNRTLRLLSWIPYSHDRAVDFEAGYGDTLIQLIDRLCDPTPRPQRHCVTFDLQPYAPGSFWDLVETDMGHVYVVSTQSNGLGSEYVGSEIGFTAARVVPLPPVKYDNMAPKVKALRLPLTQRQYHIDLVKLFPQLGDAPTTTTTGPKVSIFDLQAHLGVDSLKHIDEVIKANVAPITPVTPVTPIRPVTPVTPIIRNGTQPIRSPFVSSTTLTNLAAAGTAASNAATTLATADDGAAIATPAISKALTDGFAEALRQNLTAVDFAVRPQIAAAVNTNPNYQALILLGGLIFVLLPDMVEVDATFVLQTTTPISGEVVFLDSAMKPISPIVSLNAAPAAPGSATSDPHFAGYVAKRVSFGPPAEGVTDPPRATWMLINPPLSFPGKGGESGSYLDEICGITYGDWKAWQDRMADVENTISILQSQTGVIGGIPAASVQYLLEPGHTYQVQGSMDWTRYKSAGAGSDSGHQDDAFDFGGPTFTASTTPPTEIRRYILGHDPVDYEQPHYYKERLKVTFASDVVDRIFAKYGKQLVARAKSDLEKHVVNQPMSSGTTTEFFPYGGFEETLYEALKNVSDKCLPGDWLKIFPKSVYSVPEDLKPNRSYTFSLIPRPLGEPTGLTPEAWNDLLQADQDADRAVFRYDFRTSRYGDFAEHVAAYRDSAVLDVYAESVSAFEAALAALPNDRSDEAIDAVMIALFGGPVKIPDQPQVLRVWVQTGDPAGPYDVPPVECRAIILDGPEPLFKLAADGSEKVAKSAYRLATEATPVLPSDPALAGARWILGARGARAVLAFDEASPPPAVGIRLVYTPVGGAPSTQTLSIAVGDAPPAEEI